MTVAFLHTRIRVRDIERSIRFYTENLGCALRGRSTSPRGNQLAFLSLPGGSAELELCFMPGSPDFSFPEDIFHLAFEVEDMEEAHRRLRANGVRFTEGPDRMRSGTWMAFIEDPDGYEIELLQHAPGGGRR